MVAGDEGVLQNDRVARGAVHAGDEPGVLDPEVAPRREDHADACHPTRIVDHIDPTGEPGRVERARGEAPLSVHPISPVDRQRGARRDQHAADARPLGTVEELLGRIRLRGRPGGDVEEGLHPRRGRTRLPELGRHAELGRHGRPEPSQSLGHDDLEEAGILHGVHHLGHHLALCLGPVGMLGQEGSECGGPGNEAGVHCGTGMRRAHDKSLFSRTGSCQYPVHLIRMIRWRRRQPFGRPGPRPTRPVSAYSTRRSTCSPSARSTVPAPVRSPCAAV